MLTADPNPPARQRSAPDEPAVSSRKTETASEQKRVPASGAMSKTDEPAKSRPGAEVGNDGLTADQRQRLGEAYKAFAGAKPGSKSWYAAANVCLRYGEAGRKRLAASVEARYRIAMRGYEAALAKAAGKVWAARKAAARKKGKSAAEMDKEIREARKVIADLQAKRNLTKADLVKKADPAMATLAELVGIDRKAVFAADASLAAKRADTILLWRLRARVRGEAGFDDASFAAMEEAMALVATPIGAESKAALKGNLAVFGKLLGREAAGIRDLNRMRLLAGMNALAVDPKLVEAARGHSKDMVEKGFFSHTSPVPGKRRFTDRARLAGTTAGGENIAYGTSDPKGANRMWFHSPGHFQNMFSPGYRRMGLGYHNRRWTQLFGR